MKILILVAIEAELKRTDLPNLQIEYIGVGKVNAAFNTLKAIQKSVSYTHLTLPTNREV